jgi:phosphate transport system substrate-binding protein
MKVVYRVISYSGSSPASLWAFFSIGSIRTAMQDTPLAEHGSAARSVLLHLAGSDVIGARLAPRLAAGYLGSIGNTGIAVQPGGAEGQAEVVGQQGSLRDAIVITLNSAAAGYDLLGQRTADVAMSTTRMSPADAERLSSLGAMTSPAAETVIGLQGIVVAVNPANPTMSLTLPQLRDVFSGRITDWSELGGTCGPVHVYVSKGRDGAIAPQEVGTGQDGLAATAARVTADGMPAALASDRGGIGLLPFGRSGATKVLALGGRGAVAPSRLTIATESYPLVRRLYLNAAPNVGSPVVRRFMDWVSSSAGQQVVEAAGFVPLTITTEAAVLPKTISERLRRVIAGASRVSLDFHVQPGAKELNDHGTRDAARLAAYIRTQAIGPARLILASFADNGGTLQANQLAAQQQIAIVRAALAKEGIVPGQAIAFGADLPTCRSLTTRRRTAGSATAGSKFTWRRSSSRRC